MDNQDEESRCSADDFVAELMNEVAFFLRKLGQEDTQPIKRAFCYSVFQFVEGAASILKHLVSSYESPGLIGDDWYLALHDKKKIYKGTEERVIKNILSFAENLRFSFDIYGWTAGVDLDLTENPKEWGRFRRCISIRNRIVHPRNFKDMEVSNSDVIDMLEMFIWLKETLIKAHVLVGESWLKQARALEGMRIGI